MSYPVSILEFREYFKVEFDFTKITDTDIEWEFLEAIGKIAYCLKNSNNFKLSFMNLAAHSLFNRVGDGKGNLALSIINGFINSENLASLSISYNIPEKFLKNPKYLFFLNSKWGLNYLQFLLNCSGQFMGIVGGRTQPY